jgi:hypothetical protein
MAAIQKSTDSSSLAEVISIILDKGIVIDVWATVSLVGIQILSVEARVVIASVDTYLKYAAAIGLAAGTTETSKNMALPMPTVPNTIPAPAVAMGA